MTAAMLSIVSDSVKDYGRSTSDTQRRQHNLLASLAPDVLCLQEIWDDTDDLSQRHDCCPTTFPSRSTSTFGARRESCTRRCRSRTPRGEMRHTNPRRRGGFCSPVQFRSIRA